MPHCEYDKTRECTKECDAWDDCGDRPDLMEVMPDGCAYVCGGCNKPISDGHNHTLDECKKNRKDATK